MFRVARRRVLAVGSLALVVGLAASACGSSHSGRATGSSHSSSANSTTHGGPGNTPIEPGSNVTVADYCNALWGQITWDGPAGADGTGLDQSSYVNQCRYNLPNGIYQVDPKIVYDLQHDLPVSPGE